MNRRHYVGTRAFTLLELILIMIILCTVLAMAAPSLRGFFSSHQLNDITEHILVMTRYARIQSVFESRFYRVNIDENEHRCWLSVLSENQYEPLKKSFGNDFLIPSDIKLTFENVLQESSVYYFEFNPAGYSKAGWVRLEDTQGNMKGVACSNPSEYFEIVEVIDGKENYP